MVGGHTCIMMRERILRYCRLCKLYNLCTCFHSFFCVYGLSHGRIGFSTGNHVTRIDDSQERNFCHKGTHVWTLVGGVFVNSFQSQLFIIRSPLRMFQLYVEMRTSSICITPGKHFAHGDKCFSHI